MNRKIAWVCLASALTLGGCASPQVVMTQSKPVPKGAVVTYQQGEKEDALKSVAFFVNKDFVRHDGFADQGDYALFDRQTKTYYQLNKSKNEVEVIVGKPMPAARPSFDIQVETEESAVLQTGTAQYRAIKVNGQLCREMVTVPDLLPDFIAGLLEMEQVLASHYTAQQIAAMNVCDQALKVYYPEKVRELGFPAREWQEGGFGRFIDSFTNDLDPTPGMHTMPKGMSLRGDELKK